MSLSLYSSFIKKDKDGKVEDIAMVREEFSFLALFFSLPWFLLHKMWQSSFALILTEIAFVKLTNVNIISGLDLVFLNLALLLAIGMNANYWHGQYLQKKGYKKKSYVLAQNEEEARLKAMKSWHRNSPNLSFDRFSEEIIDPQFYLKSVTKKKMEL
jgi:hypothetical protein